MDKIKEIQDRLDKATPGDWCHIPNTEKGRSIFSSPDTKFNIGETYLFNDAVFICCAPEDIKYLLEDRITLQQENERLKSQCKSFKNKQETLIKGYHETRKRLEQENAELKKALELMANDYICEMIGESDSKYSVERAVNNYIQQVKELIENDE